MMTKTKATVNGLISSADRLLAPVPYATLPNNQLPHPASRVNGYVI